MSTTVSTERSVSSKPSSNPSAAARSGQDPADASPAERTGSGAHDASRTSVKTFVIDTNVLLHNPQGLFVFQENDVVIPFTVLEELDRFKADHDDRGRNAREAIRYLDKLRVAGRLDEGVRLGNGTPAIPEAVPYKPTGHVRVDTAPHERPSAIVGDSPDNRIIAVAYALHRAGERVVFVSKDINCRIKSDALGIPTEDFENQKVDVDHLYSGYLTLQVDGETIDALYSDRMLPIERVSAQVEVGEGEPTVEERLHPNQFVLLIDVGDESHTGLARRLGDTEHLIPVTTQRKPTFGIMPRNVQQTMALDMLLDDEIKLVTLVGGAGTGKTLLAIAAGMAKVYSEKRYEKLLVARPIMPMGRDIGYLPGDKDEKLGAWMQPIFDNLSYLLSTRGSHLQTAESHTTEQRITKLLADGQLVLEPLTYIRGRSIPHQFIIIDEAQNLSPHEIKTIVSRVGEGTKIVFTGDIQQIDSPYLDSSSNGLSYLVDRMKGVPIVGHISLAKSERSELASLATERL